MLRIVIALVLLASVSACASSPESTWDKQAWADASASVSYTSMKSLGSPGIY